MRSRYGVREPHLPHFITSTIIQWLPIFTTAPRCDIVADSLRYCQELKGLKIYAWVLLDNHLHAILAAPELSRVVTEFKRHTARRMIEQLEKENCEWLLNQLSYFRAAHKTESIYQVWQEGFHPQAIDSDRMMQQKMDYVHQNPVRRGLVDGPEHWVYSSAQEWLVGATPRLQCDRWV